MEANIVQPSNNNRSRLYNMVLASVFSAISSVLMFLSFSVPFAPPFIKLDFSELPALIASFALGPSYGVIVMLIKNIINVLFTSSAGIGEFANFIIGSSFVFTAGIIYKYKKTQKVAILSMIAATFTMAIWGMAANYFLLIPLYARIMPIDSIIGLFNAINPNSDSLFNLLLFTIFPFNLLKGSLVSILTFFLYKKISPITDKITSQLLVFSF